MPSKAEQLLELMSRGEESLSTQLICLLDGQGETQKLGEAYSMWVLPAALMIFAAKEEEPQSYKEIQEVTEQMEESLSAYLDNPCRQQLIQVVSDWMAARAVSRRFTESFSA